MMPTVIVQDGNIDRSMRDLKRKLSNNLVLSKVKSKQSYEKPGVKRKREKKENTINCRKRNRSRNRDNY